MNKNKKYFIGFSIVFILILLFIAYDISHRTTFPGGNKNNKDVNKEEIKIPADSIIILENT
ncbi:MAG: hypothetical protein M3421_08215 [Bacteroidota bacterium]|jgi:hypothetical protein|nr:hypothetical protein [Bacteroidota bacterium]